MEKTYGKHGERIVSQERFSFIKDAVVAYIMTHPGTDAIIVQDPSAHFEQFCIDSGIDMEEIEAIAYDLTYVIDREQGRVC